MCGSLFFYNKVVNVRVLKFIVNEQTIKKDPECNFDGIVKGSKGYLYANFQLSQEWKGYKIAVSFWKLGKEFAIPLKSNVCKIPDKALTWSNFYVSLTGIKNEATFKTNKVKVMQEG